MGRADGGSRGDVLLVGLLTVMTTMSLNSTTCAQVRGQANNNDDNTHGGPRSARNFGVVVAETYVSVLEVTSMDELEWSLPDVLALRLRQARLGWCNPARLATTVQSHQLAGESIENGTASFLSSMWSCR